MRPDDPGPIAVLPVDELRKDLEKGGQPTHRGKWAPIGRLSRAVKAAGTYIGANTIPVKMAFEPFNRLPPPAVLQPIVHRVDLEPESDNFSRSVDPVEILTEDVDEAADNILITDHTSRPVVENNANPDLQATNLQQLRNIAATSFTSLTASGSQGAIAKLATAYLAATATSSSPTKIRRQSGGSSDMWRNILFRNRMLFPILRNVCQHHI